MKKLLFILFALSLPSLGLADNDDVIVPDNAVSLADLEQSAIEQASTPCATEIFATKLAQTAQNVDENDPEDIIQQWIYDIFYDGPTLERVLKCPELATLEEEDAIRFTPIQYTFPNGREIIVNYETQPKIIKQRILMAHKRTLPASDPNPRIGENGDPTVWTNTDPAWYGIMVVQAGSLDKFVGPTKNNTLSVKYIDDHIDELYPNALSNGGNCTDRSAKSRNGTSINKAGALTTGDDSQDYYIAGDINLKWIGFAEIALDVIVSVATFGAGTLISGGLKGLRAVKSMRALKESLSILRNTKEVQNYVKHATKLRKLEKELSQISKIKNPKKYLGKLDEIKDAEKSLEPLRKDKNVKKYIEQSTAYSDLQKYRKTLQGAKQHSGNVLTRSVKTIKAIRAARSGNDVLKAGAKAARASKLSSRIKNYLYHSTLKNTATLSKMFANTGVLYTTVKVVGDMYDFTETSSGEFTNDIDFKPLLLLSADDIDGQENVVNYGMWLMWEGDSTNPADDDAAYLQAMDFAAKFYEDLMEVQNDTNNPCNVDIYVVRPILRGIDTDNPELYYLIMNDIPWSTNI
ncbi:MAG: hypothetical protein ACLRFK_03485 [Alphaproteobacteria bacterium]